MATVRPDAQGPRNQVTPGEALGAVSTLLRFLGRDPDTDEGVADTPKRVVKALVEMTQGYRQDPGDILSRTFAIENKELVVLDGIRFTSLCEHHLLPFTGTATVAYIPNGSEVVGISKLARVVECYAQRMQVQERMGQQIADAIEKHLKAFGVAVIIRAHHECMGCRGVRQPTATMVTSTMRGALFNNASARNELMLLLKG